jgi:hypothetical protein
MSVLNNSLLLGAPAGGGGGGYQIERSVRFNSADSAYLSRTPASAGNRKTWTWAGWVKRSTLSTNQSFFAAYSSGSVNSYFRFTSSDTLDIYSRDGGGSQLVLTTSQVFRDPSGWFHVALVSDTTQGTDSNRFKVYVNGQQVTQFSSATYPSPNADLAFNGAFLHSIGDLAQSSQYFNGYLADIHFIDGQALDPTSFGEFDANNVWQPKAYTGSYGTNGFHLDFADNSTAAALGNDAAGSNDWTVNNLSVTAGAGNDSLVDTPTNYGTDTGAGGEVRGNYATLNPLWFYSSSNTGTLSNGNLEYAGPGSAWGSRYSTIGVTSGKWYFEASPTTSGPTFMVGIVTAASTDHVGTTGFAYYQNGNKYNYGSVSTYGATYTTGDIIGVAFDLDAGSITFYKNGTSQGTAFTGIASGTYYPGISCFATTGAFNAGQRPFAYTAPSGFKALCTTNLPAPTVANGATAMDVVTYIGNGSSLTPTSTLGFNPDLIWIKSRSAATDHAIYDSVRGAQIRLESNTTDAEVATDSGVTAFNSAGFTLGTLAQVNTNAAVYAAWCWDAGSSTVTNTAGSISAQVRANASAGISVVTYTGNQTAGATVGHGLGVAPGLLIVKNRDVGTFGWATRFNGFSTTEYVELNSTAAVNTNSTIWSGTLPASTVFSVGASTRTNATGEKYVAYCFAPVAGFSAFGSYVGNSSLDGIFVYTGFKPRFVLIKGSNAGAGWQIYDTARNTFNLTDNDLDPSSGGEENANGISNGIDILSNGFKLRTTDSWANSSLYTYVYAAFAESPFQSARAR